MQKSKKEDTRKKFVKAFKKFMKEIPYTPATAKYYPKRMI